MEHQIIKNKPGIRYYFHNNAVWLKIFNIRNMKKCSLHLKGGSMDKLCSSDWWSCVTCCGISSVETCESAYTSETGRYSSMLNLFAGIRWHHSSHIIKFIVKPLQRCKVY